MRMLNKKVMMALVGLSVVATLSAQDKGLAVDVNGNVNATGKVRENGSDVVPPGTVIMWYGNPASPPPGWSLCDGTNGTPDLRGRFIVGYDSSNTSYDALGDTGGNNAVTLTDPAVLPPHSHAATQAAHSHSISDPGHAHGVSDPGHHHAISLVNGPGLGGVALEGAGGVRTDQNTSTVGTGISIAGSYTGITGTGSATPAITVQSTGSSKPFDARPPFFVLVYLIKK